LREKRKLTRMCLCIPPRPSGEIRHKRCRKLIGALPRATLQQCANESCQLLAHGLPDCGGHVELCIMYKRTQQMNVLLDV
jgi:hypothetical protein